MKPRAAAGRAAELADTTGERAAGVWARCVLGEAAARDHSPEAEGHYESARAAAEALGMRPLVARCHLGLGLVERHRGDQARATAHLDVAARMLREMGMRFWLERVEVTRAAR
jgi:hydroxypyruvate isomerase